MDNPSAPRKPMSGPSSGLRSQARLRPRTARPSSSEETLAKRNPYHPPESVPSSEPTAKRRKRSLPCDTTTQTDSRTVSQTNCAPVEPSKHDPVASASFTKLASHPVEHATTLAKPVSVNIGDDTGIPSPAEHQELELQTNEGFYTQNVELKHKVSRLETELLKERAFTKEAQIRVRQDMLLDVMHEQGLRKKVTADAEVAKRRHEKEISQLKGKVAEATETSLKERDQREIAQATAEIYRVETEHLQNVNITIQADIDELRAVEVETALVRKDESRGLPPAYGNLDDENRFPPYAQHTDGGSMEVAHLKREIRRKFEDRINEVLTETGKTSNMFVCMSLALEEACQSLGAVLDVADNVPVSHVNSQKNRLLIQLPKRPVAKAEPTTDMKKRLTPTTDLFADEPVETRLDRRATEATKKRASPKEQRAARSSNTLIQSPKGAPYVADRIAKLLIDLLWRTVAACESRPRSSASSLRMYGTPLAIRHTGVDDVLVASLRLAFSRSHSLTSFQFYLTQLEILAKSLQALGVAMTPGRNNGLTHFSFFSKTLLWLNDQVEKQREVMANESEDDSADPSSGTPDSGDDEGDSVSSRWEGSDTGSESDSEGEGEDD